MYRVRISRRSLLTSALALTAGMLHAGCGGSEESAKEIREADPSEKAKESMDYYKNNMLKKKKSKN
ncbi:hypothetical protein P12x_005983 (plasmid) [Tundrisphaera lichenicola]|uniref:hypothetical protein n=1 Tax=Tundrisphaera lichenicola TaxID=2029860 RepID=UPI003EBD7D38